MSAILEQWLAGKGFPDTFVIDGHIHIGEWPYVTTFNSAAEAVTESERYLDSNGVDAFCALAGGYIFGRHDYRLGNDFLLEVWKGMPDRLIPFLCVNPCDTKENIIAELNRMYEAGVRCIKLINSYQDNYPGDGPNLMALYAFASERGMVVLNHHWTENVIKNIAERFKGAAYIFAHYGGGYQDDVMAKFDNVYTNIWNFGPMGWLDRGIKKLGAGKFMMGSDGFLNALSVGIGPVVFADISEDDKRAMLGGTAARLLNNAGALPETLKKKAGL